LLQSATSLQSAAIGNPQVGLGNELTGGGRALGKMKNRKRSAFAHWDFTRASADINNAWDEKFRV
jgi:hypothetical protein